MNIVIGNPYKNRVVFITGGAHGIGLSLAKIYRQKKAKVVIVDIDEGAIEQAKKVCRGATFYKCDITDRNAVYELGPKVIEEVGVPYILINNAGVVENSTFLNCPDEKLERTMNVNIMSHFWILKAFLPAMIEKGDGQVCQVASAAGLMGVYGLSAYCASKHAVVGFSDALRSELEYMTDGKIGVTLVCPSFINTGMFEGVKAPLLTPLLDQEKIAKIMFDAIHKKKDSVKEPLMVKPVPLLNAVLPPKAFNTVAKVLRVSSAMEDIIE